MKEKVCYKVFSDNIYIENLDGFSKAFYYEWKAESSFCLFPGNGCDYLWDMEQSALYVREHPDECLWLDGNGTYYLGMHFPADMVVRYNPDRLREWFLKLSSFENGNERRKCIRQDTRTYFIKEKMHPLLLEAVEEISKENGQIAVEGLLGKCSYDYSMRQVERIFKDAYGYGPKFFCRKERLLYMVERLLNDSKENIAFEAVEAGYSDRAHFQREFKKFMGMTPGQFVEKRLLFKC